MNLTSLLFSLVLVPVVWCGVGCSSSSSHASDGSPSDAAGSTNGCAPANNPEGCPTQYSHDDDGESCPTAGLSCKYPGESDEYGSCGDYALLDCVAGDAGGPTWNAQQ